MNMTSKSKSESSDHFLEEVHYYRINRQDFIVYVGGDPDHNGNEGLEPGVDYSMADRFEMNLQVLSAIDPEKPILVQMASCGGNWTEGMQMFSAILHCPNPVTFLSTKDSRSMSSIIPLAADKYVIRAPGKYMFHRGYYGIEATDQEVETSDIERRKDNEMMFRLYIARLKEQGMYRNWSEEKIRQLLNEHSKNKIDVWLAADEAKRWGFVDEVFDGNYKKLRTNKKNEARRQKMLAVLRKPVKIDIKVS